VPRTGAQNRGAPPSRSDEACRTSGPTGPSRHTQAEAAELDAGRRRLGAGQLEQLALDGLEPQAACDVGTGPRPAVSEQQALARDAVDEVGPVALPRPA
jgi:hypothetical protein